MTEEQAILAKNPGVADAIRLGHVVASADNNMGFHLTESGRRAIKFERAVFKRGGLRLFLPLVLRNPPKQEKANAIAAK